MTHITINKNIGYIISAVKKEVESAWKAYKTSQEQAAERESDLQDEMRQIQKAKQTDKEQLAIQISDAAKEVEEISRQLRTASAERNDLQEKIDEMVTYSQVCDHPLENIIIYLN